jgi:serine/threonine protein kinase
VQVRDNDLGAELRSLSNEQWRDLHDRASRLEKTLQDGAESVDLRSFLPPPGAPHRRAVLHELIKTELEARYRRGEQCLLEDYLARYPELGGLAELTPSLIFEEYHVRQRLGTGAELDEYRERFPVQFESLLRLAEYPLKTDSDGSVLQELVGYKKLSLLGQGEFGEVWKALAPGGVEVALKFIRRTVDRELKALEEIKRLRHSHLLQTHSFGMMEGRLAVVMELADMSLSDRFEQCKDQGLAEIPVDWLVTYFKQAAAALDYLRSQHVSHCDIKPQNLLIQQGLAKVADFGLARAQAQRVEPITRIAGTPHYMAPEVWKQQVSSHSDQYSLAATYVHMRLGRPLFQGGFQAIMDQHVNKEPSLSALPPAEQAVLRLALAKDPDHRFPTCAAFASALEDAVAPPPPAPPPPSPTLPVAHLGLIAGALLMFVVLAVLIVRQFPSTEKPDWLPEGWEPENAEDLIKDRDGRRYCRRVVRQVASEKVTLVAVPRGTQDDPPTFYIMENKVWNDLYGVFFPNSQPLFAKYAARPGCHGLVSSEPFWTLGALAHDPGPEEPAGMAPLRAMGRLPVFRVTVTEAHCFAEWLDPRHGRLPTRRQWLKAAGKNEDMRVGPFSGRAGDREGLAIGLGNEGPWPVDRGSRDVSIHGCRQMAGNGQEWTRQIKDEPDSIPMERMVRPTSVYVVGQMYWANEPLRFKDLDNPRAVNCAERQLDVTFRVVIEE